MSVESRLDALEESLRLLRDADRLQGRRVSAAAPSGNDRLEWNSDTKKWEPKSTAQAARVFNSGALTISDSAVTTVTFDSERFDNDNIHSTSSNTGRLTATTAGKYYIAGMARFASNGTGRRAIFIGHQGDNTIALQEWDTNQNASTHMAISTLYDLAADDYVELWVLQVSGGDLNIEAIASYSPEFMMIRIGP